MSQGGPKDPPRAPKVSPKPKGAQGGPKDPPRAPKVSPKVSTRNPKTIKNCKTENMSWMDCLCMIMSWFPSLQTNPENLCVGSHHCKQTQVIVVTDVSRRSFITNLCVGSHHCKQTQVIVVTDVSRRKNMCWFPSLQTNPGKLCVGPHHCKQTQEIYVLVPIIANKPR